MTTLTESEQSAPRLPGTAAAADEDRDRPQARAMLRSLCLHASILAALAVARIALPPLDAFDPKKIEVTLTEAPKKPIAPGTADDPDSGSAAGASGGAANTAAAEPAAAPAAAEPLKPAEAVAPTPQVVEVPKPVPPPPRPRRPKPVVAQAERPTKPPTAPIVQPKLMPQPLTAPAAPDATAPAPHALVAPTPPAPAVPPPPEVTRSLPPPPSLAAAAPSSSFSSSAAGGSSATATGTGLGGRGPGAAAAGASSGAGTGYGGPGRGSGRGDEYLAQLRRWIMRYHQYPDGARAVGVATVGFQIAADGTVSHVTLERSSGDAIIDRDALNLLHRASPVPPPPPERLQAGRVEVAIPVEYEPGFFERLFR